MSRVTGREQFWRQQFSIDPRPCTRQTKTAPDWQHFAPEFAAVREDHNGTCERAASGRICDTRSIDRNIATAGPTVRQSAPGVLDGLWAGAKLLSCRRIAELQLFARDRSVFGGPDGKSWCGANCVPELCSHFRSTMFRSARQDTP